MEKEKIILKRREIIQDTINKFVEGLKNGDVELKSISDLKTLIEIYQLLTNFEKQDTNI